MSLRWVAVCGGGVREGTMPLAPLCQFSVTSPATHNQIGPFWCWFPGGWVCVWARPLWVSPTNSPMRLGVYPAATSTPMGVFNQRFEALFHCCSPGFRGLSQSPVVLSGLSSCECGTTGPASCHLAASPLQLAARLRPSYWSGWMFLLYLLGCLLVSVQFDFLTVLVVFVFKLLLSFFWLCEEAQCVYLYLHLGWKSPLP